MIRQGKISTFQMFSILFLCRIISLFTFMLPSTLYLPSGDRIITTIPLMLIELIIAFAVLTALRQNNGKSIITTAGEISPLFSKILAIIYTASFLWFAGIGVARFELFISTVMFANSELYAMTILLFAAAFYASLKGREALGRTSTVLIVILALSICFILLTVADSFEITNLKPVLTEGISPILSFAFYVSARTVELMTLLVMSPYINGSREKMTVTWITVFSLVTTIILIMLGGVTGEYGDDQIFPLYTLTVIAKFGIFERLDDILTGIWVLCSFIQVTYLILSGHLAVEQGFGKVKKIPVCFICTAVIFAVYIISSRTVTGFSEIVSSKAQDIVYLTLTVIIPLTVSMIFVLRKKRRKI